MLRVLQVASEAFPLVKTGGLADVVGALPQALLNCDVDARLLLPGFEPVLSALRSPRRVSTFLAAASGAEIELLCGELPSMHGLKAYVLECAALYQRAGGPYSNPQGAPWPDNHRRFAPLAWASLALAQGADASWKPEVVHAHDWHAGLAPAALALAGRPAASVMTIHNLAYQGLFPAQTFVDLQLPRQAWSVQGCEFYGQVSFLKAGLHFADVVSTVSPTYAREICQPEQGCGLDGVLRARPGGVRGILNGVDDSLWNPEVDPALPQRFSIDKLAGKAACKAALQEQLQLNRDPAALLFGVVSRFTEQKGLHLVLQTLPELLQRGGQLVVLGSGDADLESGFIQAARQHPGQVAVCVAHDEPLSHRIFGASDVVLVPSRFEPCGLTQLYAMAYGALPLVHRVGGLADTVEDVSLEALEEGSATGFVFHEHSRDQMAAAVRRAHVLHARPDLWRSVQRQAMSRRFDWGRAALAYRALYQEAQDAQKAQSRAQAAKLA